MKRKHVKVKKVIGVSDFIDPRVKGVLTRRVFCDSKNRVWDQLLIDDIEGPWRRWKLPEEPSANG